METLGFENGMVGLQSVICNDVEKFLYDDYPLTDTLYKRFNYELALFVKRTKKQIFTGLKEYPDPADQRNYVLFHQQILLDLAEKLAAFAAYEGVEGQRKYEDTRALLRSLFHGLDELLEFMNKFLMGSERPNTWLPADYYNLVSYEVSDGLPALQEKLKSLKLPSELVTIALAPLLKFVYRPTDNDYTYQRQIFIRKLKVALQKLFDDHGKNLTEKHVHTMLFTLNCNSMAYLNYIDRAIREHVDTLPNIANKIEMLRKIQRDVYHIVQFPDAFFDRENPQVKAYTIDWLHQEIQFWQAIQPEFGVENVEKNADKTTQNAQDLYKGLPQKKKMRLKTKANLSVKVIAFFWRVLVENHVIEDSNIKELFRDLSAIFRSKQSDFVSANSLYKRYGDIETSTAISLRDMFLTWARYIDSTYIDFKQRTKWNN